MCGTLGGQLKMLSSTPVLFFFFVHLEGVTKSPRAFPDASVKCLLLGREERRGAGEGRSSFRGRLGAGTSLLDFCFVAMAIKVLLTAHAQTHLFLTHPAAPK